MRLLVTGAGGMLGRDLLALPGHEMVGVTRAELDITDAPAAREAVRGFDAVINAAAYTAVDQAETDRRAAVAGNSTGPANLASACAEAGVRLVHVSTDYVFDGTATAPYAEDAPVRPASVYGSTKAAGELLVRTLHPDALIVRTAWLYAAHGQNFMHTMLRLAAERDTVSVVTDQVGQPTSTPCVATAILALLEAAAPAGTYHATCAGQASWFEFAQEIFRLGGHDPARVLPTTSAEFVRPAPRPAYSVLGHDRIRSYWAPVPWQDALRAEFDRLESP